MEIDMRVFLNSYAAEIPAAVAIALFLGTVWLWACILGGWI
jgi:hypothetical protein